MHFPVSCVARAPDGTVPGQTTPYIPFPFFLLLSIKLLYNSLEFGCYYTTPISQQHLLLTQAKFNSLKQSCCWLQGKVDGDIIIHVSLLNPLSLFLSPDRTLQSPVRGERNLLIKVFIFQWMVTLGTKVMMKQSCFTHCKKYFLN